MGCFPSPFDVVYVQVKMIANCAQH